jgi:hypothetical protein
MDITFSLEPSKWYRWRYRSHEQANTMNRLLAAVAAIWIAAANAEIPRAPDGKPDLSGVWDFKTLTPLERPAALADIAVLTPEKAAELEAEAAARSAADDKPSDANRGAPPKGESVGAYNSFWFDRGAGVSEDLRTSLIVDPSNGRLPPTKRGIGRQNMGEPLAEGELVRFRVGGAGADGPEQRGIAERCLLGFSSGPPITPGGYNQNIGITQTNDHIVILNEMVHDARIVPLGGQPRLGHKSWLGDSRGRWEGDTLVVETVNFHDQLPSYSGSFFSAVGTATQLRVIEKFQRLDEKTLKYEFTVDDPATYDVPITGVLLMKNSGERIYEYACHEGNYAMRGMLAGARVQEQLAAEEQAAAND